MMTVIERYKTQSILGEMFTLLEYLIEPRAERLDVARDDGGQVCVGGSGESSRHGFDHRHHLG